MVLTAEQGREIRDFLCENGYCVVPNVLSPEFAEELRVETARLNAEIPHNPGQRYQGTHLDVGYADNPLYDQLVKWPPARQALEAMGMGDFQGAGGLIVLTKEPKAPTLYWHQGAMARAADSQRWQPPARAASPLKPTRFGATDLSSTRRSQTGCTGKTLSRSPRGPKRCSSPTTSRD